MWQASPHQFSRPVYYRCVEVSSESKARGNLIFELELELPSPDNPISPTWQHRRVMVTSRVGVDSDRLAAFAVASFKPPPFLLTSPFHGSLQEHRYVTFLNHIKQV